MPLIYHDLMLPPAAWTEFASMFSATLLPRGYQDEVASYAIGEAGQGKVSFYIRLHPSQEYHAFFRIDGPSELTETARAFIESRATSWKGRNTGKEPEPT